MGKNRSASGLTNIIQYDNSGNITFVSGSTTLMSVSSSGAITTTGTISGSDATNALLLDGTGSLAFTMTASYNVASASLSSRTTQVERTYASTGSNTFTGAQFVSDTSNAISFTSTASLYSDGGLRVQGNSFVSGTAYFNNIVVYGTSSVQYITSSQVNVGTNIITVNTDTPAVRFGGLAVFDSGSTQLTGSILWDSEKNHWVYSNPSGSNYNGGMFISGPRNSGSLGSEQGTTSCMLLVGQGGDHLTSSLIYHDSTKTCFYGTSFISSSGMACFGGRICSPSITTDVVATIGSSFACPTAAGLGYGIFGYTGIGLGIASAGTGANQGIGFFTCGDFERLRILSSGVSCFSGTVCAPNLISTDATHTTLRISCAIVPLANYRTSDCGYGGADFFDNGKGYACAAKFYTFKTSAEYYGLTNDYNGSAQLALVSCGAGSGNNISFFTGTSATAKLRIDNNATCISCQLSVGPSITIGNQGGTDTTVIGGGSGVGSLIRMNYAGGSYNNYLAGNGDNYFNCLLGKLNAAGGVKYGGGATTLNYYEEGTWTPWFGGLIVGGSASYAFRSGTYVRIGNWVMVRWGLKLSSISGQIGTVQVCGLPFAGASWGSYQEPNISISTGNLATPSYAGLARLFVQGGGTVMEGRISNNGDSPWNTNEFNGDEWIIGEIFYNIA